MASSFVMAQRKEKRMSSNRESARRSRMRKQKHLDDLLLHVGCLRREKNQIFTSINVTWQQYIRIEAENSVLRVQMMELSTKLYQLSEIIHCMNFTGAVTGSGSGFVTGLAPSEDDCLLWPWSALFINQARLASDMFSYC